MKPPFPRTDKVEITENKMVTGRDGGNQRNLTVDLVGAGNLKVNISKVKTFGRISALDGKLVKSTRDKDMTSKRSVTTEIVSYPRFINQRSNPSLSRSDIRTRERHFKSREPTVKIITRVGVTMNLLQTKDINLLEQMLDKSNFGTANTGVCVVQAPTIPSGDSASWMKIV